MFLINSSLWILTQSPISFPSEEGQPLETGHNTIFGTLANKNSLNVINVFVKLVIILVFLKLERCSQANVKVLIKIFPKRYQGSHPVLLPFEKLKLYTGLHKGHLLSPSRSEVGDGVTPELVAYSSCVCKYIHQFVNIMKPNFQRFTCGGCKVAVLLRLQ